MLSIAQEVTKYTDRYTDSKIEANPVKMSKSRLVQNVRKHQDIDPSEQVMMNPIIETLIKRQSVRLYEHKPIPKEFINTVIEAAHQVPLMSDQRFQPLLFVIVRCTSFSRTTDCTFNPSSP